MSNQKEDQPYAANESTSINAIFQSVTSMVHSSSPPLPLSDDIKLQLYGLYKRSTIGTTTDQSQLDPPSRWNIVAYRKYQAWSECDHLTLEDSMTTYVELVSTLDCDLGRECQRLLEDYSNDQNETRDKQNIVELIDEKDVLKNQKDENNSDQEETKSGNHTKLTMIQRRNDNSMEPKPHFTTSKTAHTFTKSKSASSLFTKLTGVKPFIPRGQLDISSIDILLTILKTIPLPFNRSSMRKTIQLEEQIEATWKENNKTLEKNHYHVITGLSVRSLLDLYLSSKSFENGSEVIIVPPINIEGMINVLEYHGLKVKPIDIQDFGEGDPIISVDIEKVREAISSKTVAVMIVHPFGIVCMREDDMKQLKQVLDKESAHHGAMNIELWEDCAECYTGNDSSDYSYNGSSVADLQFFSFGTIKTATALGAGIAVLKQSGNTKCQKLIAEKMKRIQHMTYEQQKTFDYFVKLYKVFFLYILSTNRIVLSIFIQLLDFCGIDYDDMVTSSVKGFPQNVQANCGTSSNDACENKLRISSLIQRLRKRPCPALLSLLHRRLRQPKKTSRVISSRITRCENIQKLLKDKIPSLQMPNGSYTSQHLYWLFPIMVQHPESVSRFMKLRGFDVPKGTSQLGCITSYLTDDDTTSSCPNAEYLMKHILYLPIASIDLTKSDVQKLIDGLRDCLLNKNQKYLNANRNVDQTLNSSLCEKWGVYFMILIAVDFSTLGLIPFSSMFYIIACRVLRVCLQLALPTICAIFLLLHVARSTIGMYYINCSKAFAKFNSIFNERNRHSDHTIMNNHDVNIIDTYTPFKQSNDLFESKFFELPEALKSSEESGKNRKLVLLTGATGFIGSLLLRDLLMHRQSLGIHGVVLICRSKRKVSAAERVKILLEKSMFSFLSEEEKRELVIVMEGDVSSPNIGMNKTDLQRLYNEINITHVFNCAACVSFVEPLENAAESNITSALQLQQLIKKMKNRNALYIYFSTAFIHGNLTGSSDKPLPEELFNFGRYDPSELYSSMMSTQSYASKAMCDLGFPNTYTFSKSICEHLLMNESDVKTIIIRPSIVGPSIQEPYEGWAGEKPSTLVAGACLYMKNPYNLWTFRREKAPVIPVDVVTRFVLSKVFSVEIEQVPSKNDDEASKLSEASHRSSELSYVFTKSSSVKTYLSETDSSLCSSEEQCYRQSIYTAAWDYDSPSCAGFLWYDFACAIVQLSTANGHVGISLAYFVLLISFRIFLSMNLTFSSFEKVHKILVHGPFLIVRKLCGLFGLKPKILKDFEKLSPFLDLPLLFFPFTTATFYFHSELSAPTSVNGERYMVSCILAAEDFIKSINKRISTKHNQVESLAGGEEMISKYLVAGRKHKRRSDMWWALTQPRGSYIIRLTGFIVSKLLRCTTTSVTVDMESMANVARAVEQSTEDSTPYIILASTHRSYYDFLILSFISFSLPELGIPIPYIAAADDFSRIPLLGWLSQLAGAFFLSRGRGIADPVLKTKLMSLKGQHSSESPTTIEVFLEGKRSRDRRFMRARTGFLK